MPRNTMSTSGDGLLELARRRCGSTEDRDKRGLYADRFQKRGVDSRAIITVTGAVLERLAKTGPACGRYSGPRKPVT